MKKGGGRKPMKIIQFDKNFKYIDTYESINEASRQKKIDDALISKCAKFWSMNCDKEEWKKKYKNRPIKYAGGYVWRFYSDFENRD